ncbi:MAG: hypothetical protein NT163_07205 [Chlorobiales bacterium]|nr:hypothetical protein [Chlorobiales bacterium]
MRTSEITTVTTIPILKLRAFEKLRASLPKRADIVCAGCSKPLQLEV